MKKTVVEDENQRLAEYMIDLVDRPGWQYLVTSLEKAIEDYRSDLASDSDRTDYFEYGIQTARLAHFIELANKLIRLPESIINSARDNQEKVDVVDLFDPYD
jgi:hypothetical protein